MEFQFASRANSKIKMGLQGPSSSGKTYSALLVAYGLCGSWQHIAVIDTENGSSHLYAHLGAFRVLPLSAPFSPEAYIQAISFCQQQGMQVIIIDSISHEWDGVGGILQIQSLMPGNSFTNWAKVTPRHNAMMQCILQSDVHIICTIRSKHDYVLVEKNGKVIPEKVGLKGIQRNGFDYDLTILFELDTRNQATATKDRTALFYRLPASVLTINSGKQIQAWCARESPYNASDITTRIEATKSIGELLALYQQHPSINAPMKALFESRKKALLTKESPANQLINQLNTNHGTSTRP